LVEELGLAEPNLNQLLACWASKDLLDDERLSPSLIMYPIEHRFAGLMLALMKIDLGNIDQLPNLAQFIEQIFKNFLNAGNMERLKKLDPRIEKSTLFTQLSSKIDSNTVKVAVPKDTKNEIEENLLQFLVKTFSFSPVMNSIIPEEVKQVSKLTTLKEEPTQASPQPVKEKPLTP
jgi:hypothetical protein